MPNGFITGTIERITSNGCALLRTSDRNYFVHGAARGETVLCREIPLSKCNANRNAKHHAELVEVLTPSAHRVDPECALYGICGGCSLRHIDYETQLEEKCAILRGAFLHIAGIDQLPDIAIHRSPPNGYRNRAQFHRVKELARNGGRRTALPAASLPPAGFIARDGVTVVPVPDCPILEDTVRDALRERRLQAPLDRDRWTVYGRDGQLLCEGGVTRGRYRFGTSQTLAEELIVDAGVFFQSNGVMLEQLISWLFDVAQDAPGPAGDFYAGTGVFAAFLRRRFAQIDLLEENRAALALARENLSSKGKDEPFRFFGVSDTVWVKQYGKRTAPYGFLCVDPGRGGLSGTMLRWLCEHPPKMLVYISCECSALARDTRSFAASGFTLESLDMFDFYPQTPRLETVALFRYDRR